MTIINELTLLLAADNLESEQVKRETSIITDGVTKALENASTVAERHGSSIFAGHIEELITVAESLRQSIAQPQESRRIPLHELQLLNIDSDHVAGYFYTCLVELLAEPVQGVFKQKANSFYSKLGRMLEAQARANRISVLIAGQGSRYTAAYDYIMGSSDHPEKAVKKLAARFDKDFSRNLNDIEVMSLGKFVADALLPIVGDAAELQKLSDGAHPMNYVVVTTDVYERIELDFMERAEDKASLGFMVCPPRPLVPGKQSIGNRYISLPNTPRKDQVYLTDATIEVLNSIQSVQYTTNTDVLNVLMRLRGADRLAVAQSAFKEDVSDTAATSVLKGTLAAAAEATQWDAIYFPVAADFRTRVNVASYKGFGPQGSKVGRSLLLFCEASPLGAMGLDYLYLGLANAFGYDKEIMVNRLRLARDIDVAAIAADPLLNKQWLEADEPVAALAFALEIAAAVASGDPESYESALPVHFDGTCNALQHIALVTKDETGAAATNVTGDLSERRDIYAEVAAAALAYVTHPVLLEHGNLRKLAKLPVMTFGYGVTEATMLKQIQSVDPSLTSDQATEFRDALVKAIEELLPQAFALREWLQACTREMVKAGVAPEWLTGLGNVVMPAESREYTKYAYKSVRVCGMKTNLPNSAKAIGMKPSKHINGVVANFIHSMDASGLMLTAAKLRELGVENMSFIHDSYATTAGDAAALNRVLREAHAELYQGDVLADLHSQWEILAGRDLPAPPARGELDVAAVLSSPYFFS